MLTARIWRERFRRYRNQAGRCLKCGRAHYPPRLVCDGCGGREFETFQVADTGKIVTFTIIRIAPPGFEDQNPYVVAVLEMDDTVRIMAQVVDIPVDEVKTGMRVRLEFRKIRQDGAAGVISYGHKAVPA